MQTKTFPIIFLRIKRNCRILSQPLNSYLTWQEEHFHELAIFHPKLKELSTPKVSFSSVNLYLTINEFLTEIGNETRFAKSTILLEASDRPNQLDEPSETILLKMTPLGSFGSKDPAPFDLLTYRILVKSIGRIESSTRNVGKIAIPRTNGTESTCGLEVGTAGSGSETETGIGGMPLE